MGLRLAALDPEQIVYVMSVMLNRTHMVRQSFANKLTHASAFDILHMLRHLDGAGIDEVRALVCAARPSPSPPRRCS